MVFYTNHRPYSQYHVIKTQNEALPDKLSTASRWLAAACRFVTKAKILSRKWEEAGNSTFPWQKDHYVLDERKSFMSEGTSNASPLCEIGCERRVREVTKKFDGSICILWSLIKRWLWRQHLLMETLQREKKIRMSEHFYVILVEKLARVTFFNFFCFVLFCFVHVCFFFF